MKVVCLHASITSLALVSVCASTAYANTPDPATRNQIAALSVPFVPNAGQWDQRAAFAAQTFAGTLFVTRDGQLVYSLPGKPVSGDASAERKASPATPATSHSHRTDGQRTAGWVLSETLVDARGQPRSMVQSSLKAPAGYRAMEGKVSYGIGNDPAKHANNLNTYERVSLGDMYPGINVQLRATGNNVEKIFTVAPQQDPAQINIKLAGADKLEIGAQGELIAHTGNGPVTFTAPIAFQESAGGERTPVAVAYTLNIDDQRYGFTLGSYDASRELIIDPLLQSTYHGGNSLENGTGIAVHPQTGEVYLGGYTDSNNLQGVTTATGGIATGAQPASAGSRDAFVVRFNSALTVRLQTTYFGGSGYDQSLALAIHPFSGEVYIAGQTNSASLPSLTPGTGGVATGAQTTTTGTASSFIARFNATLTSALQATFLGGNNSTDLNALAIHPITGDVYVAGNTSSSDFPFAPGGAQPTRSGSPNAFISRLTAELTAIVQSTYHGGSGSDSGYALAVHPFSGDIYLAGTAGSTNLPGVTGGAQPVKAAGNDSYVTRFNAALTTRYQSTYNGGAGNDQGTGLAIHPFTGDVYLSGITTSSDLPGTIGGAQPATAGADEVFVTRFTSSLVNRLQSTYLGGGGFEASYGGIGIHPVTGDIFLTGYTNSAALPGTLNAWQPANAGGYDAFVSRLDATLATILQSTFHGGNTDDRAFAITFHPVNGEVYIAGIASGNLPLAGGGAQPAPASSDDAFVSRFSFDLRGGDAVPDAFVFTPKLNVPPSSQQTSNPVLITGISGPVPISVVSPIGTIGAQYCVSSTPDCTACNVLAFTNVPATISNNQYACVRQSASTFTPGLTRATLVAGGGYAHFFVSTGTQITSCNLDIDGSGGAPNAASDGLMLVRAMLGFTGTAVTNGAISGTPPRNTWPLIRDYLNQNCGTNFGP